MGCNRMPLDLGKGIKLRIKVGTEDRDLGVDFYREFNAKVSVDFLNPTSTDSILKCDRVSCTNLGLDNMAHRNPAPTVDIIIELIDRPHRPIVLIERKNEPFGWAIPGGFVDYGETVETAAIREAEEETGLKVQLVEQFHLYSDPSRDPRQHTISLVFIATAT